MNRWDRRLSRWFVRWVLIFDLGRVTCTVCGRRLWQAQALFVLGDIPRRYWHKKCAPPEWGLKI